MHVPATPPVVTLRKLRSSDLELVRTWLDEPHVARWYLLGSTAERELEDLRACLAGTEPTHLLTVVDDDRPIGWCQWYHCADYPDHAAAIDARPGDIGIDYAIGDPSYIGRGVGTELVSLLVDHVRDLHPSPGSSPTRRRRTSLPAGLLRTTGSRCSACARLPPSRRTISWPSTGWRQLAGTRRREPTGDRDLAVVPFPGIGSAVPYRSA